jgi:hypothetical protein
MKKFLTVLALATVASSAMAGPNYYAHRSHEWHGGYRGGWVAPALIGGVIGYGLSRPYYDPVYVQPAPVVIQQPPVYVQPAPAAQQCTRYIYQDQNGQTIREETRCN